MPADIVLDPSGSAIAPRAATADTALTSFAHSNSGADSVAAAVRLPNPQLTVDPSTARVVYEYFNTTGLLTNSVPSAQQLAAYRLAAEAGGGASSAQENTGSKQG